MGGSRSRIALAPLHSIPLIRLQVYGRSVPAQWDSVADLTRGDGRAGVLIRHQLTGSYALWNGVGSIESVPQNKVAAALATLVS